ncbi:MAG: glycosyltransferase family 39 protein, partial [bacterium]|nr:glycosyltransferase family 39 protein [bacterium]
MLVPILLLAAILRLYKIEGYMTFLGDEGRDALVVYNILHGNPTLLGPTASVGGFFMGPVYYYFMAPFLWLFNYNPVGPAVMVALFGITTVFLVYKIGSEFFGKKAAIIASLLYSISHLDIAYSRSSWNPNLMPFFSLLTMYVLHKAVIKNKFYLFILTGFLYGITIQLHYISLFLGTAIILFVFLRTIIARGNIISGLLKSYFFMLLGFIIGWSPFLAFEFRHGFP